MAALALPSITDFLSGRVKSLGWGVLQWCSTYLGQPDGANKGESWEFTPEQALFILRFYAINDVGKFIFNHAILERPKGWGKSPLMAAMCCAELLGPVRFKHFDINGMPVGRPEWTPLVQIAAISEAQTNNTYDMVMEMLSSGLAFLAYDLQGCIHLSKVVTKKGAKIEKVTSSPRGREGQRTTFVVCDETHLWVPAEKGPELMDALKRNSVKTNNRVVETTNAFVPGELSAAETSHDAVDEMIRRLEKADFDAWPKTLFDSRQVFVEDIYDYATAMPALKYVYGDSAECNGGFVDLDRIWEAINDPAEKEHVARRFYFNQHILGHTTWLKPAAWRAIEDPDIKLRKTDDIALGFKITPSKCATIVACRLRDGALFNLSPKGWEKRDFDDLSFEVPGTKVDRRMRKILEEYNVHKVVADGQSFQDIIGRWSIDHEDVIEEFWISNKTKMAKCVEQFEEAVYGRRLKWNDEQISRHVLSCHVEELPQGQTIRQETKSSVRYIVAAQAAVLAVEAAVLAIEEGALKKTGTVWSI